ncbi:hypothetical protein [Leptolyngbya sp. Cla-17]|nr:hypothetical protein [Leptolyngbya sp. Cla-17]
MKALPGGLSLTTDKLLENREAIAALFWLLVMQISISSWAIDG